MLAASLVPVAVSALSILAAPANAASMAYGQLDFVSRISSLRSRDYVISYNHGTYADSTVCVRFLLLHARGLLRSILTLDTYVSFCKKLHSACVDYVGGLGGHHQLDCVYEIDGEAAQTTTLIHAFCGGIEKDENGEWTSGQTITDYTSEVLSEYFAGKASIKEDPLTKAECEKFAKNHVKFVFPPVFLSR
ncbi:hypothetical protein JCM8547_002639 [Rhodosporidiobolus lusitaniae]